MKKISKILKDYKEQNHWTYQQLADDLQISKSNIYAYIKEKRNPSLKKLEEISKKLSVDIALLLDNSFINKEEVELVKQMKEKKKKKS